MIQTLKTKDFNIDMQDELSLSIVTLTDVDWYVDAIFEPFFYEFLEYKPGGIIDKLKVKTKLIGLIGEYTLNNLFNADIRLIIKYKDLNIGGITIIKLDRDDEVELAYWVIPEYQNRGIATAVIKNLITYIKEEFKHIDNVILQIMESNEHSIKLAEKLKFKLNQSIILDTGEYKYKYIKQLERREA